MVPIVVWVFFPEAFHVMMGLGIALKTQQVVVYYCVGMLSHRKRIVSSVMGPQIQLVL